MYMSVHLSEVNLSEASPTVRRRTMLAYHSDAIMILLLHIPL